MVAAGVYVYAWYRAGEAVSQWWVWLIGLLGSVLIDACLGLRSHDVPKTKTEKVYDRGVHEDSTTL